MAETQIKSTKGQDSEKAQEKKRRLEPALVPTKVLADESIPFPGLLGDSVIGLPIERHAALLSDPHFSGSVNNTQKAGLVTELQQNYGNAYVQRVIGRIQTKKDETIPEDEQDIADIGQRIAQEKGSPASSVRISSPSEPAEKEVEVTGQTVAQGGRVTTRTMPLVPAVQLQNGEGSATPEAGPKTPPVSEAHQKKLGKYVRRSGKLWGYNQKRFNLALRQFERTMTMTPEQDAVPDYSGALGKYVVETVTKRALEQVAALIPGYEEVMGAIDALVAELERAGKAAEEVALKQFIMQIDEKMTRSFEKQSRAIDNGEEKLLTEMQSLDEKTRQMYVDSFPNWLKTMDAKMPADREYEAQLHIGWVNLSSGQVKDWKPQGTIEIKFNAETPGKYVFESAKVLSPFPKKSASGLNRAMKASKETGMKNVLDLPIKKMVGLYCENLVGGVSYQYAHMDEFNKYGEIVGSAVARERWHAMPWSPFEKINEVKG